MVLILKVFDFDFFELFDVVIIVWLWKYIEIFYDMKDIGKFLERCKLLLYY